jgi:hypothetical protein
MKTMLNNSDLSSSTPEIDQYWASAYREIASLSIYDSMSIIRPGVYFRDGIILANPLSQGFGVFLQEIPYNESYYMAMSHLIPSSYDGILEYTADLPGHEEEWMNDIKGPYAA